MTNCLFFGDSITFGEYDGVFGGYVDYLKRFCYSEFYHHQAKEVNCFNLGIGGETTFGLLNRFDIETKARLSSDENLFFFFYGANDLAINNGNELVSLQDFEKNLIQIIKKAKSYSENVYLISILPISQKIDGVKVASGKLRSTEQISRYNETLKKISTELNLQYLDIFSNFNLQKEELISKDGIHPNEKGYELIAENLKPILSKYL